MGYHNIINSPPRFYIDQFTYLSTTTDVDESYYEGYSEDGNIFNYPGLIGLNPSNTKRFTGNNWVFFDIPTGFNTSHPLGLGTSARTGYIAVLGHTLKNFIINSEWNDGSGGTTGMSQIDVANSVAYNSEVESNGFTIFKTNTNPGSADRSRFVQIAIQKPGDWEEQINSISWGMIYDMPVNPDLNVQLIHEWDGTKTRETKGGATLTNALYHGPPDWGTRKAWQIGDHPYNLSGRRSWRLTWSSIADSDMQPYSYYGNQWSSDTGTPTLENSGASWYYDVLRLLNGGANSFIFCPISI